MAASITLQVNAFCIHEGACVPSDGDVRVGVNEVTCTPTFPVPSDS